MSSATSAASKLPSPDNRPESQPAGPSSSYRPEVWNLGRLSVRLFPSAVVHFFIRYGTVVYFALRPQRKQIVLQNLLPAFNGNINAAKQATRRLIRNFAAKLVDLWRFETGTAPRMVQWTGWEHFVAARQRGNGLLLVTAHLGNWELGAPFLTERGVKLLVLTQAEPKGLTQLREKSRAKWGIETLVVGNDAFAFLEVVRRLQEGATVALLVDRPPPPTAVTVELFGRPFAASIAAAELARASGCSVLPVFITQSAQGYSATGLPAIDYDRRALGNREARRQMTQQIISALEPAIRQHIDQWYHFVPVWNTIQQP